MQGHYLAAGNTRDAVKHGVAIVPQELASIEDRETIQTSALRLRPQRVAEYARTLD